MTPMLAMLLGVLAGAALGELVRILWSMRERARWRRRVVFGRDGWPPNGACAFLLAAGLLCGAAPLCAEEPPASVEVLAGAAVVVSEESDVVPVARITVDAPVYVGRESIARIRAALQVHGSVGETVDLADVATFRGAELDVELERRIGAGQDSATYVVLKVGGAARRDALVEGTSEQPHERFPGWWGLGLAMEHRVGAEPPERRLVVAMGSSQLCHEQSGAPRDLIVAGHVRIAKKGGAVAVVAGEIHRPIWGEGRSMFRLSVLAGWGS